MDSSIYIFDAGSTKTDLLIFSNKQTLNRTLCGYNPNRDDTLFSKDLKELSIPKQAQIFFYGSGVGSSINRQKVHDLFPLHSINIESDLLGAARSTLFHQKGIVCILGTGGVVAFYDGNKILNKKGGYGYLIDDIGGGLELGKLIVSNWLDQNYNENTNNQIKAYFNWSQENFTSEFYKNKDLHLLSNICKIIPDLTQTDSVLKQSIIEYFKFFFNRHVLPLSIKYNESTINLVGSIAHYFHPLIKESVQEMNLKINVPLKQPIQNLLKFHLLEK